MTKFATTQNKGLIALIFVSIALETILYFFLRYLGTIGVITTSKFLFSMIYLTSVTLKMVFPAIIIWRQHLQRRYLFYGLFIIASLIFFYFFIMTYYENGVLAARTFASLSFGFSLLALVMAILIGVDPSIEGFPKFTVLMNTVLLMAYRTPALIFLWLMTMQIFGTNIEERYEAILAFNIIQLGVFVVWALVQAMFVSRIDYI